MSVSRQPMHEAIWRLAKHGLLQIRPQSRFTVSLISEEAVQRARFIRTALEVQTCRTACEKVTGPGLEALAWITDAHRAGVEAQDRDRFNALYDQFHREIRVRSGVSYVRELVHDIKAGFDRIRTLSQDLSP